LKKKYKLFANGNIYTVNKINPKAEAVVTGNGKIEFAGNLSDAKKRLGFSNYEFIDLRGSTMLPGFIDSHLHLLIGARYLTNINLSEAIDKKSFQRIIREFTDENKFEWYLGGNWNEENFSGGKYPDKSWIDEVIPDVPVFLTKSDLHMGLANAAALRMANISEKTKNPPGGIIERHGETGKPTGILKDNAMRLILDLVPQENDEERKKNILKGMKFLNSFGVTSAHDLAMENYFHNYEELFYENKLSLRINYIPLIESVEKFSRFKISGEKYNHFLKRIALKSFADGSLGSSTAWFFDGYFDERENRGLSSEIFSGGALKKLAVNADNYNINLLIHAIGDRANHEIVNLYEEMNRINGGKERRNRIEHCQHIAESDFIRFAENKIIASMQPYHLAFDGSWCERKIGKERLKNTFPISSLAKRNVKLIFGSDWPVVEPSPLKGIAAAATRKLESSDLSFINKEKISVMQAVEAYTINAAFAEYEEKFKGSIEVGKFADFVILDRDIFHINPDGIKKTHVEAVVLNGKLTTEGNI